MRISARPIALFADFSRDARLAKDLWPPPFWPLAAPGAAGAGLGGGYDGLWNVLIITQAGSCDPAYSYPFRVSGGRISSAGAANVSGSVGRGGGVMVRISAGGSVASGSGTARRQFRRGPLERQSVVGELQRPLAGDARLTNGQENGPPDRLTGRHSKFINAQNSARRSRSRISAAPEPSPPGGLRSARPARPWRSRRRRS